jgi:hypothetical protein
VGGRIGLAQGPIGGNSQYKIPDTIQSEKKYFHGRDILTSKATRGEEKGAVKKP